MRRRLTLALALLALAACTAGPATAAARMLIGLQDDAQLLYGDPDKSFPLVKALHVQIVRANLLWNKVAPTRPLHPQDPNDPAYDWGTWDRAVLYSTQYKARVLFTIYGTPRWANGGGTPNRAPKVALDLQKFAYAAAKRYSGTFVRDDGRVLPPVRYWMAWNEPNAPAFLAPQYARKNGTWVIQSAIDYAKICTAVFKGVHSTLLTNEKVACGGTNPRGNNDPASYRPSTDPLTFMRALKSAGLKTFDAYAHHPYYQSPTDTPATKPKAKNVVTLGNIDTLITQLTALWGKKRLWLTEYGYQTNPPDNIFGVNYARQAAYLKQAFAIARKNPRIDMMVWFLLRDEPRIGDGWQSGLLTMTGKRKPAFNTFAQLPH